MIIGIITRKDISPEGHSINVVYDDIYSAIKKSGGIPLGIILDNDYKDVLSICKGVVFQGGSNIEKFDFEVLKYLNEKDIPTLGICLGMQEMGLVFNGCLGSVYNHKKNLSYAHSIKIKNGSKLSKILNLNTIKVNSRHKDYLMNTDLDVSAISNDGIIEAVEDSNKKFFIGVQWHPESMISYDKNQNKIFKSFINECKNI